MSLNNTFRNLGRTREIIGVLIKYGFEDLIANSTLRNLVTEKMRLHWLRDDKPALEYTRWERIRMAAVELGPTFVKLAQVLSNRPDIVPEPLVKEFEKLQDRVPPFEFVKVKLIIERETHKKLTDIFDEFSEVPIASASIGQVHKAKLKTGEEVVVKVQRPEVQEIVERDLNILREVVRRSDRYLKKQGILNAEEVVHVFERSMHKELDYLNEARNIERFRNYYKGAKNFYVPKVYREFSTSKIMIMEFVRGCKITDVRQLREWGIKPEKVVERGMDIYLTQIFEHGFFHGDPHPGNVLVRQDGTIILLDFGMVGQLMKKDKYAFAGIFIAMSRSDAREMAVQFRKLAVEDNITDMRQFVYDLNDLIEDYAYLDVSESSIQDVIVRLQKIMFDYKITVPGGVFIIFRAFAILEGIGKKMHPNFKTYDFIKPYGQRLIAEQLKPENLAAEAQSRISNFSAFLNSFPVELRNILQKTQRGKLHFEIELQGYGYALKKWDSVTNRIVITYIICALILGSSIALLAKFPEEMKFIYGINKWSFIGYCIAGGLFLILLYTILRKRVYK
ncbi:MAG: AarF/ABC1/UbiB kinase family protein [Chitinophagales bacterium]|nr:AarF/ABC1/UbiB kinase family protein [Chitinophagales bacterium]MCO5280596.1 AarF/ABC1/UbiB kinase family protein [Chitinophagales bacterium]OJV28395.1 MAG: ubiquinone biosynthesis protein [Bacteroidetes bacterium 37-13]HRP38609.1 AarF/ABC1/UbiB kinase family protein [Chitinophagales bacterium]